MIRTGVDLVRRVVGLARHVSRDCGRGIGPTHLVHDTRRFFRRTRRGRIVSWPRHSLQLYEEVLRRVRSSDHCRIVSLEDHVRRTWAERDAIGVVLRHDVDVGDVRSTIALCEVETRLNLVSSVHLLVDDALYRASAVAPMARELRAAGFDVGLHTQAWMYEDYAGAFRADIARFGDVMQFLPSTMTLHGAWPRTPDDLVRRRRFLRRLPDLLRETTLVGYDNDFDWVSEDSNVRGRPAPLRESFMHPDRYCYLGGAALILTHDAHWAAGP